MSRPPPNQVATTLGSTKALARNAGLMHVCVDGPASAAPLLRCSASVTGVSRVRGSASRLDDVHASRMRDGRYRFAGGSARLSAVRRHAWSSSGSVIGSGARWPRAFVVVERERPADLRPALAWARILMAWVPAATRWWLVGEPTRSWRFAPLVGKARLRDLFARKKNRLTLG
jgi:hypothetical protein